MDDNKKRILLHWIIFPLISIVSFVAALLIQLLAQNQPFNLFVLESCMMTSGIITLLSGGFVSVAYFGGFDMLSYGASSLFYHMRTNPGKVRKYKDYTEYVQARVDRNGGRPFYPWAWLSFGGILLIVGIILLIIRVGSL